MDRSVVTRCIVGPKASEFRGPGTKYSIPQYSIPLSSAAEFLGRHTQLSRLTRSTQVMRRRGRKRDAAMGAPPSPLAPSRLLPPDLVWQDPLARHTAVVIPCGAAKRAKSRACPERSRGISR
jgi:hypothetical protein